MKRTHALRRVVVVAVISVAAASIAPVSSATMCSDGWLSPSTGSGTCSHHGGILGGAPSDFDIPSLSGGLPDYGGGSSAGGSGWTGRFFSSPSGNIQCRFEPSRQRLGCSSLNTGMTGWVSRRFTAWTTYSVIGSRATPIPYGDYWTMGGFTCYSQTSGMSCYPPTGTDSILVNKTGAWAFE